MLNRAAIGEDPSAAAGHGRAHAPCVEPLIQEIAQPGGAWRKRFHRATADNVATPARRAYAAVVRSDPSFQAYTRITRRKASADAIARKRVMAPAVQAASCHPGGKNQSHTGHGSSKVTGRCVPATRVTSIVGVGSGIPYGTAHFFQS